LSNIAIKGGWALIAKNKSNEFLHLSMKILLIGEYSRLHNSLKEGLMLLGYEVIIQGFNDGFKDYPVDLKFEKQWDSGWKKKVKVGIYKLTGFDITSYLIYRNFKKNKSRFSGFDVVQLINENSFFCQPNHEIKILRFIFENNKKIFLLSCGDDFSNVDYNFKNPDNKSVVQPYLAGKIEKKAFLNVLKFRQENFRKLHEFIYANISGVIATDMDYHLPLAENPKYLGLIPNPVNVSLIQFEPIKIQDKIVIFLGINDQNYYKKGCDHFEKALQIVNEKYSDQIEIIITKNIPYQQYIRLYDRAHILLDQTYSKDQGYNALEAMAKGKVVFTGAESEFIQYYELEKPVNINASPDVTSLVNALSKLIENPNQIIEIGKNARDFIEKEHNYKKIAQRYLDQWANS